MRLAFVTSHPIQYNTPLFRALARRLDLVVFFGHRAKPSDQARAGFGVEFDWDIDLVSGYDHEFLRNIADPPALDCFDGCNTPEISARLNHGRFDAVLVQGWYLKSFLQAVFAAKRIGLPVLVRGDSQLETPRSLFKRTVKATVYPAFLRLFDAALHVGERSRNYLVNYRYPPSRLFFSPHCVDTEWFAAGAKGQDRCALRARLDIPSDCKAVLFAGKLVPFKRPMDVVAAVAHLKRVGENLCLLIAGAGALERDIASAAQSAGVSTHMLGFCNQSLMPRVYAGADVLVLPSDGRETWGLVANEALACGCPVVLSDAVGSAPDLAADGVAGRMFPVGNIMALADAIREILHHPPSPRAIALKSAAYSLDKAVDGIVRATTFVAKRP